ncbi:uncharacterized protein B0T15DRAFT_484731 [Chaetomium strumarium]|uniref:Uncharacterized protein n=1 Tax=Chaetomium strumarium TaxID=1170767 RepID=A0AAJ0GWY0_9PEZI|nr:hypothetical protein B0T15DRAFT_484731 [Chaetomium strumarium]
MDNRIALSPFLFLIICFFSLAITAQSNDTTTASTAPNQEARVGWVAGPNQRGTLTLVYGCLSTIFASTWTVLHLNVPGPHDEWWRKALRKAKWMAVTVLFPEFVFSKAVCELRMAVANLRDMHEAMKKARAELRWEDSVQREYPRRSARTRTRKVPRNRRPQSSGGASQDSHDKGEVRRRWTLVHCLYANMGGLVPYPTQGIGSGSGGPGAQPVTTPMLAETIRRGGCDSLKHFVLDRADIEDKSKADWLLRTIAVMQIVWLVLNVAARAIARVPVTQLEIATVAFSITAIATYAANWWKPKDIGQPTALPRVLQGHRIEHWAIPEDYRNFQSFVNRTLKPSYTRELQIDGWIDRVRNDLTWMRGDPPMPRMFYALMAVSSLVFGGFHCLAWNVQFPSETEQVLWRAASIMSAALPGVSLALTSVINVLATTVSEKRFLAVVRKTLVPLHRLPEDFWRLLCEEPKCLHIIYAVSRLAILILLFTSLRSVPEAVYENSPWTRFLPNIS